MSPKTHVLSSLVGACFLFGSTQASWAQCSCGPTIDVGAYSRQYHLESQRPVPLGGLGALAEQAANTWTSAFSSVGNGTTYKAGPGDVTILVSHTMYQGGTAYRVGNVIWVPEVWIMTNDYPSDFILAILIHEMGHTLGFGQSPYGCYETSVMSDTHLGWYRTNLTPCDSQTITFWYGLPRDPCEGGCPAVGMCGEEEEATFDECGCQTCYSPIFLQLDNHPFEFSSAHEGVPFDMFGLGVRVRIAWPVSEGTAWLVLDRNHNGRVDDGTELFGNTRRLESGKTALNGYEVLAELDANGDGVIDREDPVFGDLLLWRDSVRDGLSQADELEPLREAGIVVLYLDPRESRRVDREGNRFRYRAKVDAATPPKERFSWDVFLTVERSTSPLLPCATSRKRQ